MADVRPLAFDRPRMPLSARLDALTVYSTAVIATGAVLLVLGLPEVPRVAPFWFATLLAAEVLASLYKVSLQLPGGGATMTLGLAVGFAALLTMDAGPAALIVSAGIWAQCTYRTSSLIPLRQRLFSVACGAITVELADHAYNGLNHVSGHLARELSGLSAASLVYFAVNTSLVAGAVALSKGQPFAKVWRDGFLWSGPSYFISAAIVGLALEVADHYGPLPLALAAAPLVLTYRAYKVYLGRVAEEQRQLRLHMERMQQHHAALADLARDPALHAGDFAAAARRLTEGTAGIVRAARVDLWLFEEGRLTCADSFAPDTACHTLLPPVDLHLVPGFTDALGAERVVVVDGTGERQRPWRLGAAWVGAAPETVLHAPVRHEGRTVGVVTASAVAPQSAWSPDDHHFLGSIADLAALAVAARNRRDAQDELRRAKEAAEAASVAKSAFVATMSHELRTPLNAIIGYTELLIEEAGDTGADALPDLRRVARAAQHLLGLVNDVLDFSKIEAGKMVLHAEPTDIAALVADVVSTCQPAAHANGNELTSDGRFSAGDFHVDAMRLRQVLLNLVGNGCKFTRQGTVTVRVRAAAVASSTWLEVDVADTGIGISPAQMARLFGEFVQADASTTRRFGGTGLGLAISQRFCLLMGGTLTATSVEGQGSVFTVRLPDARQLSRDAAAAALLRISA